MSHRYIKVSTKQEMPAQWTISKEVWWEPDMFIVRSALFAPRSGNVFRGWMSLEVLFLLEELCEANDRSVNEQTSDVVSVVYFWPCTVSRTLICS